MASDFYYNPSPHVSNSEEIKPKVVRQLDALKKWAQPEIKKEKSNYPFDTPQRIDHVTKIMKEEADHKLSSKENKDIDILNKEMKLSVLKDEIGGLRKYDNLDRTSYPSDPEQRRRLKNIDKLEKSLGYNSAEINAPYKQQHFTDRIQEQDRRKKQQESKQDLTKTIPEEVNQIMNNELESIRQMRREAERLRRIPEFKFKTRKPEPAGLHETFTQDKLLEGSILKQIKEDNEKI